MDPTEGPVYLAPTFTTILPFIMINEITLRKISTASLYIFPPLLIFAGAFGASAAPILNCSSGPTPAVFTASAPSGNFVVPRDAPVGTILSEFGPWQGVQAAWECKGNVSRYRGVAFKAAYNGQTVALGGSDPGNYEILPTSLPGVGIATQTTSALTVDGVTDFSFGSGYVGTIFSSRWWSQIAGSPVLGSNETYGYAVRVAFVKTGPITSGIATAGGPLALVGLSATDVKPIPDAEYIGAINISGSARFSLAACTTPDVTVDLGQHVPSDFPSIGSRRGASGTYTDFVIALSSCAPGMNKISYTLRPLDGEVSGVTGSIKTTAASSARGIAVRMADRSDSPMVFNAEHALSLGGPSDYFRPIGGDVSIPLRAWIERTDANFDGGFVQARVEFIMKYE